MRSKQFLVGAGGLATFVALVGLFHRNVDTASSNGGLVRVTSPSVWSSCLSGEGCKVFYQPRGGDAGTIIFYESSIFQLDVGQPAMIVPATDGKCFFVLYDADVDFRLLKVDPTVPSTKFKEDSYLNYIVLSSPWKVEEGTSNNWEEVCSYLNKTPPNIASQQAITTLNLGIVRFHYQRKELLSEVEREIYNSKHGLVY